MSWCKLATMCTSLPNLRIPKTSPNDNRVVVEIRTPSLLQLESAGTRKNRQGTCRITMRDRSSNRRPLQKGRNLSIEAIQTIQALKRANKTKTEEEPSSLLEQVFVSKFKRLLKLDMMAVLKELIRQNECFLALKVPPSLLYLSSVLLISMLVYAILTLQFDMQLFPWFVSPYDKLVGDKCYVHG